MRYAAARLAREQREISVAEFFAKNRHLLGFDSPARALLTVVKEAVDNALDACDDAGVLPDLVVEIEPRGDDVFRVAVQDNGPGIVERQIGRIFGELLYGSKFHVLRQSRGQQGIGISAAGMYGQLTTGEPMRVLTRTGRDQPAVELSLSIDLKRNRPIVHQRRRADWTIPHGTRVEIVLAGHHQQGPRSVSEYLRLTALANPHARIRLEDADGSQHVFARTQRRRPPRPRSIRPHPHGVELGMLAAMLSTTKRRTLSSFLRHELSRIGHRGAMSIIATAGRGLRASSAPRSLTREQLRALHRAANVAKVAAPSTDCLVPIGETALARSLAARFDAELVTAVSRRPSVYRGYPFQVELALVLGRSGGDGESLAPDGPARVMRLANRVPMLFQPGACAITQAIIDTDWHHYGLAQARGALPTGPVAIIAHVASAWVPFTSEAKEAIAAYPEIERELRLGLQDCGRRLRRHLDRVRHDRERAERRARLETFVPHIADALQELLGLDERGGRRIADELHASLADEEERAA